MPAATPPPNPQLNFYALAARAMECCQQWRAWAQREPKGCAQARRAFEIAMHFEKQASILSAMHRNRTEWTRPTRENLRFD